MKKTVLIATAVILVSAAGAQTVEIPAENGGKTEVDLQHVKQSYNTRATRLPEAAGFLIDGQRIILNLELRNETRTVSMETEGRKIARIKKSGIDDPTVEVWLEADSLRELYRAERPRQAARKELGEGDIRIETYGFLPRIKMEIVRKLII